MTMQVECIPVLRDSMSYLLIDTISNEAAIIDAADINKVEAMEEV